MIKLRLFKGKSFMFAAAMAGAVLAFSSCGGKKDPVTPKGKTAKFTISATGLSNVDYDGVTLVVVAGSLGSQVQTFWKVNGTVRNNERGISIGKEELLAGGTIIIESVAPMDVLQVDLSANNFNEPFTLSFKSEINGQVKETINQQVVEGASLSRDWTY